jgi:AICAR transformylase/IMP cyclohydrolase PurH
MLKTSLTDIRTWKMLLQATQEFRVDRRNKAALKSYRNQQDHDLKISQFFFGIKDTSTSGSTEIAFSKAQT